MAKEPAQRFRQPGEVANAYHQIVAPHDTQRVPFFVVNQGGGVRPGGDMKQDRSGQSGNVNQGGDLMQGGGKPRPYISGNVGDRRSIQSAPISRRRALTFIAAGGGVAAAVLAVAVFGRNYLAGNTSPATTSLTNTPANTPIANVTNTSSQGNVVAHTSDLPINSAKTFPISSQTNPGVIVHLADGHFVAFNSTCTHAGCAVNYNQQDKLLECPCHSASFNPANNAAVVQGPAQTPLAAIKISVNANGTITLG
jgi:eukaryotic-like serine/threonine-protein kinase